jgi:hypothetical protein
VESKFVQAVLLSQDCPGEEMTGLETKFTAKTDANRNKAGRNDQARKSNRFLKSFFIFGSPLKFPLWLIFYFSELGGDDRNWA